MATKRTSGKRPSDSSWVVLKFGGTSVSTAERWQTILGLVKQRQADGLRPVVVHSALATVSNRLDELLRSSRDKEARPSIEDLKELHYQLAGNLGVDGPRELGEYFNELEQLVAGVHLIREISPRIQARAMAMGELLATRLGAAYLRKRGLAVTWLDARALLRTVNVAGANERGAYLAASCDFDPDPALQHQFSTVDGVALTQGFIASNPRGECVLLGRGG